LGPDGRPVPTPAALDSMQWIADPLADGVVADLLQGVQGNERIERVQRLNDVVAGWTTNRVVRNWQPPAGLPPGVASHLQRYLAEATRLPAWADERRIANAERLFMDFGPLSVTILFCASLPECYVVPDLAAVLHSTGQLEKRADHRIRSTGAMIFPVMMRGGLTSDEGGGIAQIVKVRLIHAMVRNLILRDSPEKVAARALALAPEARTDLVPPAASPTARPGMHCALHEHGWDFRERALPNNQEELAYTLLTFSYVFLRGLSRLGNKVNHRLEDDYLHAWNVAGHVLGIREDVMVDDIPKAAALFRLMQERGRAEVARRDDPCVSRERLAAALIDAMRTVMPPGVFQSFPVLLTKRLVERASARDLGLDRHVSRGARAVFRLTMALGRGIDAVGRIFVPRFSLSRLFTRIIGYHMTTKLLMDQTRPLQLPAELRPGVKSMIEDWGRDPLAGARVNRLEDRFTTEGKWCASRHPAY
jgi:hypothetical protein